MREGSLFVLGLSHRNCSIDILEKTTFSKKDISLFLSREIKEQSLKEGVVLSTCNRTELYGILDENQGSFEALMMRMIREKRVDPDLIRDYFFLSRNLESVKHLFRVASGADSVILGEADILGQVKEAYRLSKESGFTGKILNRLFQTAIASSKHVRHQSQFQTGAVSVSYAAVELSKKIFSDLSKKEILLIGAGKTATRAAQYLLKQKAKKITIVNRSLESALKLAESIEIATVMPMQNLEENLFSFDIILSAVSEVGIVLRAEGVIKSMQVRNYSPALFLDLGVPRNIDPHCSKVYNVFLKNIDDLKGITEKNIKVRQKKLSDVYRILDGEAEDFENWRRSLDITSVIQELSGKFNEIKKMELQIAKEKLDDESFSSFSFFADRLTKKLLHYPIQTLKKGVDKKVVQSIFDLSKDSDKEHKKESENLSLKIERNSR